MKTSCILIFTFFLVGCANTRQSASLTAEQAKTVANTSSLGAEASSLTEVQQSWLSKANRHERAGWVYVHIEGTPRQRGFQHGYLLAKEIAQGIKATRTEWEYQSATKWEWLLEKAAPMFVRKIDKENLAELDGIVEGMQAAGVPSSRAEMIAYNGDCELSWYWWPEELKKIKEGKVKPPRQSCSAFIATGSMTADGVVVLGHNSMQGYYEVLPNVIIDIIPEKGHRILMQTYPGWIHSGTDFFITDAGLVGAETTIGDFEGFDSKGVPEFSRMRRATQDANSIEKWCAIMKRGNNGGYANAWLLGDVNTGEIARLELGLKYVGFEKKRDGYFVGSNVAEDLKVLRFETTSHETDIRGSEVARRVRWKQLMSQHAGRINVEAAKLFEADHFDAYLGEEHPGERSICAHWDLESKPIQQWPTEPNGPWGTVDAKVVDTKMARQMSFAARWGSACGMAFDSQKFLAEHPQYEWMKDILQSRPSEQWTTFAAGEER
ncbi:MAG: C45 family peptidase [Verrucomicrobiota bacterium]|jgi:hypothetical protein